jgi:hypothetical protein
LRFFNVSPHRRCSAQILLPYDPTRPISSRLEELIKTDGAEPVLE